eukprot:1386468-Pleurochrysis_carterae.AAC.2
MKLSPTAPCPELYLHALSIGRSRAHGRERARTRCSRSQRGRARASARLGEAARDAAGGGGEGALGRALCAADGSVMDVRAWAFLPRRLGRLGSRVPGEAQDEKFPAMSPRIDAHASLPTGLVLWSERAAALPGCAGDRASQAMEAESSRLESLRLKAEMAEQQAEAASQKLVRTQRQSHERHDAHSLASVPCV